jgi:hypothetical protein
VITGHSPSTDFGPKLSIDSFRLTDMVEKRFTHTQSRQMKTQLDSQNINVEIINRAKK